MGSDQKHEIADTSGQNEEFRLLEGAQSRAAAPPRQKESAEVVRASDQDASRAHPTGRRPRGRPRTHWRDYIPPVYVSHLAWERLRIPQEELESVAGEKGAWRALLSLLLPRPGPG